MYVKPDPSMKILPSTNFTSKLLDYFILEHSFFTRIQLSVTSDALKIVPNTVVKHY